MAYRWLLYVGFAAAYTWFVFWAPFGEDSPPIWSNQNLMPRRWIFLIHSLFLAAYLGVLWSLSWIESSVDWLTFGGLRHLGAFYILLAAVFTGTMERLLLYRGPEPSSSPDENDSKNETQRVPGE